MKKVFFSMTIACFAMIFNGAAQDTTHTLIKLIKPQTIGLYVAPEFSYGQLRGGMTSFGGASAMVVLNKKWAIGVTGQMSSDENFVPKAVAPLAVQSMVMGGIIEFTPRPDALIHVSFPLMIGGGEASADSVRANKGHDWNDTLGNGKGDHNGNGFIVVQPGIHLEANLLRYAKIYVGANYRLSFLTDNQTALLPANTLQGFSMSAGLKLGLFDYKLGRKKAVLTQ